VIRSGSMLIVNDNAMNHLWSCKSCLVRLLIRFKEYSLFMLGIYWDLVPNFDYMIL